jgi:hypothetical protein
MLLRHTTKEVRERNALTVNPAKTCQPVGAMYAALGVHGCLPHSPVHKVAAPITGAPSPVTTKNR